MEVYADQNFGDLLRRHRRAAGLTQEELAERASLSVRGLSDLERGVKQAPHRYTVQMLADALELSKEDHLALEGAILRRRGRMPTPEHSTPTVGLRLSPTPFIGRKREVEEVRAMLLRDEVRLLTLTGPGGVGKTRLALRVAEVVEDVFPDGITFVSLAPVAEPELVPSTIASSLGLKEVGTEPILKTLTAHLTGKRLLLVLDNLEHLLGAADTVVQLLASCPALISLVTSRAVLRISSEHEYPVPPLTTPTPAHLPDLDALGRYDAVQLFVQRAQAVKPSFELVEENGPLIAEICWRLDGLPLAIELAAARIRLFPPPALLARLSDRLQLLTGGPRDAPDRLQTLRNTIHWSYSLLSAEEQMLFVQLGVFAGGCTVEAVEAVCNQEGKLDVLEGLTRLLDQSLVQQRSVANEPRFLMLETLREYAVERLETLGLAPATRAAHASYFLELAERADERADERLAGPEQGEWLDRLDADYDNLRAALRTLLDGKQAEEALRLGSALAQFWVVRGGVAEGRAWLEEALGQAASVSRDVRARGLMASAYLLAVQSSQDLAEARAREALQIFRELDDVPWIGYCVRLLGVIAFYRANLAQAQALLEEALTIAQTVGSEVATARTLGLLGMVVDVRGDRRQAAALLEESVQRLQGLGELVTYAQFLSFLARALGEVGDLERSASAAREGLDIGRKVGCASAIVIGLMTLGDLALQRTEYEQAADLYDQAVQEARKWGAGAYLFSALSSAAQVAIEQGDHDSARGLLREALDLTHEHDVGHYLPFALEVMSRLSAAEGQPERSVRLFAGAEALRGALGAPAAPSARGWNEKYLTVARTRLDESDWAASWDVGLGRSVAELLNDARDAVTHHSVTADPVTELQAG
jgi:predicted ATPase/DNA-binding XRE family transcriptional regulator